MIRGKKGIDYAAMMVLVVFICVVYLFLQLQTKITPFQSRIGESQVALLNTYQDREKILLYVDQTAQYATHKAVYELAAKGGFETSPCGTVQGYALWNNPDAPDTFCFPNVHKNYKNRLTNIMNFFAKKYPLPQNNYKYFVENKTVHGIAIEPVELLVQPPPEKRPFYFLWLQLATDVWKKTAIGRYAFKPSFSVDIPHDLDVYQSAQKMAEQLVRCKGNTTCMQGVGATMKPLGNDVFSIELPQVKSPFEADPPVIQFALKLPASPKII